jgi:hypothetical protein
MKTKLAVKVAAAACSLFASSFSFAAASVAAGSVVKLGDGVGTLAGVFLGTVESGPGAPGSFLSFCLEKKEYFNSHTQSLYVKSVTNASQNSTLGTSGAYYAADALANPEGGLHTASSDRISKATEWIFTQFYANQSTYAGTNAKANSTQRAIWYLEGELNDDMASYTGDALAQTFVANANAAVLGGWTDVGDRVRVLNLYTNATYTAHSQDQLYMVPVPEPETYAMMLAGLGLIGFVANRRRRKLL